MKKNLIILCLLISMTIAAQTEDRPVRVALFLPLQTEVTKRDKNMDRFVDFYSGALLAVYEQQAKGHKIEVFTYDVGKTTHQMYVALDKAEMEHIDMAIGPAYASQVAIMAEWALQHQVLTLLPFSSEIPGIERNPYLMQFNPSYETEADAMALTLANRRDDIRCIFISAPENSIPQSIRCLQQRLLDMQMECVYTTVKHIMNDSLADVMSDTKENILLMNTERFANLRPILPQLDHAAMERQLTLLSRYSWRNEAIGTKQIYSTVFRQEDNVDDMSFDAEYRYFFAQPRTEGAPNYDLLGYDLMSYVLKTSIPWITDESRYGEVMEQVFQGVQSDILFTRIGEHGGYYNTNIHIIRQ